ncbi:MAG: M48 family metallopeptidase [Methylobacter sp.]
MSGKILFGWTRSKAFRLSISLALWLFCYSDTIYALCPGEAEKAHNKAGKIGQEWPLRSSNDGASQYLQRLGQRLATQGVTLSSRIPDYDGTVEQWHFLIVRDLSVNAFSIGNGWIYVTDGSFAFVNTESELAAMLSHEIGHQMAGHFCESSDSSNSGGVFDIFSTQLIQQDQAGVGSMLVKQDPVKEQQADQIALAILGASGYDSHAILDITRRLPSEAASHLLATNRIQFLERIVANNLPRVSDRSSEEFYDAKRSIGSK